MTFPTADDLARLDQLKTTWHTTLKDRHAIEEDYKAQIERYNAMEAEDWERYNAFAELIGVTLNLEPAIRFDMHEPDEALSA